MIAQRLSTIRSADQILVLEGGEIVESSTREQLIARDGRYEQLDDKQYNFEFERDRFRVPRFAHPLSARASARAGRRP